MYDAAYTTNGYDTFGGGPSWKGDLEKFDVWKRKKERKNNGECCLCVGFFFI
jgi:hypothetical protein